MCSLLAIIVFIEGVTFLERNLVQNMGHCQSDQDQKPKPHSKAFKTTNLGNLSVLQEVNYSNNCKEKPVAVVCDCS